MKNTPHRTISRLIGTLFLVVFFSVSLFSQNQRELLAKGNMAFKNGDYHTAAGYFTRLVPGEDSKKALTKEELHALYHLAESLRLSRQYRSSYDSYTRLLQLNSVNFPDARYNYAVTLMNLGQYDKASEEFAKYLQLGKGTRQAMAARLKASCEWALNKGYAETGIYTYELDSIFNRGDITQGIVYFTGSSVAFAGIPKTPGPGASSMDIYISGYDEETGNYDIPVQLAGLINSDQHELPGSLSPDRQTFYFTRWPSEAPNNSQVYMSRLFRRQWTEPVRIEALYKEGFRSMHPFLSPGQARLYFVSDRPGGQGGLDIWFAPIDAEGNTGEPVNAGNIINTPGDEVSPFYHAKSQTLYFSSNGHTGMGGLDVFKASLQELEESWETPVHLGVPINSPVDDFHFIMDDEQLGGFYTSDRKECNGCTAPNTQRLTVFGFSQNPLKFILTGNIYSAETDEPLTAVQLSFVNIKNSSTFSTTTDEQGHYSIELPQDGEFFIKASADKYETGKATVKTAGLTKSAGLEQDFFLKALAP